MFVERLKKIIQSTESHRPVNFICKKAVLFLYNIFTASDEKGFYLLPIVKLLDSYKVYSIIKVDPCGEVRGIGFSGVFHVFSVQKS